MPLALGCVTMWALLCNAADFRMWCGRVLANVRCESQDIFDLFWIYLLIFLLTVMYVFCVTDFSVFCSNSARKCGILPAYKCSLPQVWIMLKILPAEFIQAYLLHCNCVFSTVLFSDKSTFFSQSECTLYVGYFISEGGGEGGEGWETASTLTW